MELESEIATLWVETKKNNPNTKRVYKQSLADFEGFIEKNLDRYLKELGFPVQKFLKALKSESKGRGFFMDNELEGLDISKFWQNLTSFHKSLTNLSPNTRKTRVVTVKNFFRRLKIEIPEQEWKNFQDDIENIKGPQTQDRCGKAEEWRALVNQMFPPARAFYLTLLSSGMRPGELLSVKMEGVHLDKDPPRVRLKPSWSSKIKRKRTVFITDEAEEAIKKYLEWREGKKKRNGEPWEKDDLLFPLDSSTTNRYLKKAKEKAGFDNEKDPDTGRSKLHQYSTRKYFNSKCGLDDDLRHRLMGHSKYLSESYSRQEEEEDAVTYREIADSRLRVLETEKTSEGRLRETEISTLRASLRATGVSEDRIEEALKMWATSSKVLEEMEVDQEVRGALRGKPFEEVDLAMISKEAFEDLKERLLSLATRPKQKVINEEELEKYLANGWRYVDQNNNGKIIVEK